jgi:3',5'-cyclic AMP phosphodiesterase CpdA
VVYVPLLKGKAFLGWSVFTFAHLSDPHLPLPAVQWRELFSKRVTGWLSWRRRRRFIHRPEALAAALADVRAVRPDHIVVTGDIANISTLAEFRQGADWLGKLGPPADVTVAPGNHDAYVAGGLEDCREHWASYMAGDGPAAGFPAIRRRGPLVFVSLSTAVPTPVFVAAGRLGDAQIARFEEMMRALADEGLCRVVLIHHPPQKGGASRRKGLTDAEAFRAAVARVGAELILHGHNHRTVLAGIETPDGGVPVLGAASASATPGTVCGPGGYNLIRVNAAADGWTFDVEVRVIRDDLTGCIPAQRFRLLAPRATGLSSRAA